MKMYANMTEDELFKANTFLTRQRDNGEKCFKYLESIGKDREDLLMALNAYHAENKCDG